jgi:hypothetical protein
VFSDDAFQVPPAYFFKELLSCAINVLRVQQSGTTAPECSGRKEDNIIVGKLTGDMLDYLGESGPSVEPCRLIVVMICSYTLSDWAPTLLHPPTSHAVRAVLKMETEDDFGCEPQGDCANRAIQPQESNQLGPQQVGFQTRVGVLTTLD